MCHFVFNKIDTTLYHIFLSVYSIVQSPIQNDTTDTFNIVPDSSIVEVCDVNAQRVLLNTLLLHAIEIKSYFYIIAFMRRFVYNTHILYIWV